MTLGPNSKFTPVVQRRVIGNLLRLADACLRDAKLLSKSSSLPNAAILTGLAVAHIVEAIIASEQDQISSSAKACSQSINNENPIKARLRALEARVRQKSTLLPNGNLSQLLGEAALRDCTDNAATVLVEISEHFDVDLVGEEPAGSLKPMRPEPITPAPPLPAPLARRRSGTKVLLEPMEAVPERSSMVLGGEKEHSRMSASLHAVRTSPPQSSPPSSGVTSVAFWSLMDRWDVADLDALVLLGHAGGLTRKGTRPRFKLSDAETDMFIRLRSIDDALNAARLDPRRWLRKSIAAAPFLGTTPLAFIKQRGLPGARALSHYVVQQGLRLSARL